jgi:hypothetical protein
MLQCTTNRLLSISAAFVLDVSNQRERFEGLQAEWMVGLEQAEERGKTSKCHR